MISVVVPTFRHQARLRDLLSSLEKQVTLVPFEVIVVANLPEPGLKKAVESYGPQFRFHETGRIGVNIARNKGLERARGSVVVFLDDDVFVNDREFLQKHFDAHEKHPEAIAIGGGYTPKASLSSVESAYHWILHHALASVALERNETQWLYAGNVSFKTQSLESRHRFDDRILFGASEASLFGRLHRDQNLFLIYDSLSVEHRLSTSLLDLARRAFFQGYGRGLIAQGPDSVLVRPHWNSILPLEETVRRAHVKQTWLFSLAVRVYRRFQVYGYQLGLNDSELYVSSLNSKKVIYRRPDFSLSKILMAFFGGRWRRRALISFQQQVRALKGALTIAQRQDTP